MAKVHGGENTVQAGSRVAVLDCHCFDAVTGNQRETGSALIAGLGTMPKQKALPEPDFEEEEVEASDCWCSAALVCNTLVLVLRFEHERVFARWRLRLRWKRRRRKRCWKKNHRPLNGIC